MPTIRFVLGLLLALALLVALRLPFLRCEPFVAGAPFFLDEREYVAIANAFARGDASIDTVYPWMRAPATSFMLLSIGRLRGVPPELAACDFQRVQIGLWALVLLSATSIAAWLFDRRTALITALLVAIVPDGIAVTLLVHSDLLFCLWLVATVALILQYTRHPHPLWLIAAGITAGVGALSRSPMLPSLPILALWAASTPLRGATSDQQQDTNRTLRQRLRFSLRQPSSALLRASLPYLGAGALLIASFTAVIAPWTIRNVRVHGGLIISDTLGAVNLWNDNTPERHISFPALLAVADNPVDRQKYAMRQAIATIQADPVRFVRKVAYTSLLAWSPPDFKETFNFWQGLSERPRIAALLTQLDTLLALVGPLAALGMLLAPHTTHAARSYRLAVIGLALSYTAMIGITHYEARFRLPFLLLLLPYAAWCAAHPRSLGTIPRTRTTWPVLAAVVAGTLFFAPTIWPAQWNNARALVLHSVGLIRAQWGDLDGALADQQAAGTIEPELREARVAEARLQARLGDLAGAEQTLRRVLADAQRRGDRTPPDAVVALQQILSAQGRSAETAALDQQLSLPARRRAEQLAWQRDATPPAVIELGRHDLGFVRGFYAAQTDAANTFRWSRPAARIALGGTGNYLCLQLNAARPADVAAPALSLQVSVDGYDSAAPSLLRPPRNGWAWLCAALDARQAAATRLVISLRSASYNPFARGDSADPRDLGVAIAAVVRRSGPLAIDPATGLLMDRIPTDAAPPAAGDLALLGITGTLEGPPGVVLPLTIWWRGTAPSGSFTFLHLLDDTNTQRAAYNAPFRNGQPATDEGDGLRRDDVAIPLPADLPPGTYRLEAGVFDPASGAVFLKRALGAITVVNETRPK